jgi:hypothetical protein
VSSIVDDIRASSTTLLSQAGYLKNALGARLSQANREYEEASKRIKEAEDKLEATIAEAESTDNPDLKSRFYKEAVQMAISKKLELAMDLIDKLKTIEKAAEKKDSWFWYDICFRTIAAQALKENKPQINVAAVRSITNLRLRAGAFQRTAEYYFANKNPSDAADNLKEAFKIASEVALPAEKLYALVDLISPFQKIDKDYLYNVTQATAKAIEALPKLDVKDEEGSVNYQNYVIEISNTNQEMPRIFKDLLKKNRQEALDFANRINRREYKIFLNYLLLIDELEAMSAKRLAK